MNVFCSLQNSRSLQDEKTKAALSHNLRNRLRYTCSNVKTQLTPDGVLVAFYTERICFSVAAHTSEYNILELVYVTLWTTAKAARP